MSIVSRKLDSVREPLRKFEHLTAPQWGYDDVPVIASPPQKPTVNQFRKIRVPSANPRPAPKTNAPLMFEQEGAEFLPKFAEEYDGKKLKGAEPTPSRFSFADLLKQQDTLAGEVPFDYNAGIRPGKARGIKFSDIAEPTGDTFRR